MLLALYLGREYYQEWAKVRYNTGGPGYLLDSEALKVSVLLIVKLMLAD